MIAQILKAFQPRYGLFSSFFFLIFLFLDEKYDFLSIFAFKRKKRHMRCRFAPIAILCGLMLMAGACKNRSAKNPTVSKPVKGIYDKESADRMGEASPSKIADTADKGAGKTKTWPRAMELPAPVKGKPEQLLRRTGYYVSYNANLKVPNWVAWHLTAAHTEGRNYRDGHEFYEDEEVAWPRATNDDYRNSKYDRGHLCPSGDNKWDKMAQRESFLFTNICPQNHQLNKGDWNDLEQQCRYWAKKMGDLYVVAGPVFYHGAQKTIGRNGVAVPDAFFKVLLSDGRRVKAIGFLYPNDGGDYEMDRCVRSVDEIERLTGFDFFPLLDDGVEDVIEAASNRKMIDDWQVEKAVAFYRDQDR